MDTDRTSSILFSDVAGSSKIQDDSLKVRLRDILNDEVLASLLTDSNHFYTNTWGDGVIVCSDNPLELAKIALTFQDRIRERDWLGDGFVEAPRVRIALHTQRVKLLLNENGTVRDVIGKGIEAASRIEPIVEPGDVVCSAAFNTLLQFDAIELIRAESLGRKRLAKDWGEMDLFRLVWDDEDRHEPTSILGQSFQIPRIQRKITDKERTDFLYAAFAVVKSRMREMLDALQKSQPEVDTAFREINSVQFVCEIYVDGALRGRSRIWTGNDVVFKNSICYYEGVSGFDSGNAVNEWVSVEDDGFEIYLRPSNMSGMRYANSPVDERLTPEAAADYFLERLLSRIGYRR